MCPGRRPAGKSGSCSWGGALVVLLLLVGVAPGWAGEIRLRVGPAKEVRSAQLIERESETTYQMSPAGPEQDGLAVFEKTELPQGVYDVVLLTNRGRVEGVNLKAEGVADDAPELKKKDVAEIRRLVTGMTSFSDRRRILFLRGRGTEARVLVEELTTRKTTLPSGQPFVVWRVEVWHYRKEFGAWDRYDWGVIARERPSVKSFESTTWVFAPELGGLRLSAETPGVELTYQMAEAFDPDTGLVASPDAR